MEKIFNKTVLKIIAIISGILLVGFVIFITVDHIINHDKTSKIDILVAPSNSEIIIDEKPYDNKQTIRIKPGTYKVTIRREGFNSFEGVITVADGETLKLYEFLTETDENGTFYSDNADEATIMQQISDYKADKEHEDYIGSDPVWNYIPYYSYKNGFRIYPEKSEDEEDERLILNVKLITCSDKKMEELKKSADEYLKSHNLNLENYNIKYSKLC